MCFSSGTLKRSVHKVNTGKKAETEKRAAEHGVAATISNENGCGYQKYLVCENLFHEMF